MDIQTFIYYTSTSRGTLADHHFSEYIAVVRHDLVRDVLQVWQQARVSMNAVAIDDNGIIWVDGDFDIEVLLTHVKPGTLHRLQVRRIHRPTINRHDREFSYACDPMPNGDYTTWSQNVPERIDG